MFRAFSQNRFFNHFLDLVIVIVGITIAFQLEKYDNQRHEDAIHSILVEGLLTEITRNLDSFETVIPIQETNLENTRQLRAIYRESHLLDGHDIADKILEHIIAMNAVIYPDLQTAQLDNYLASTLASTGVYKPKLLKLKALLDIYKGTRDLHYKLRIDNTFALIGRSVDLSDKKVVQPENLVSTEFKNHILFLYGIERELTKLHTDVIEELRAAKFETEMLRAKL